MAHNIQVKQLMSECNEMERECSGTPTLVYKEIYFGFTEDDVALAVRYKWILRNRVHATAWRLRRFLEILFFLYLVLNRVSIYSQLL